MSGLFSPRSVDPWFRLGRLEVGTTMLVTLAVIVSWLAWVAAPSLAGFGYFSPEAVLTGEVWRVVSWPLVNPLSIWAVINLFLFWYFGSELEQITGKQGMVWLLVGIWASLTVASSLVSLLLPGQGLAGIGLIQFAVLLIWIAEYPTRPFFFGIPAWVLGTVLVGLQVLLLIAARDIGGLLSLLLSLILVAIAARRIGLLRDYPWIPGARSTKRPAAAGRPRAEQRTQQRRASDRERLDALLDQINDHGIDSLTPAQRRELTKLRDRLRKG